MPDLYGRAFLLHARCVVNNGYLTRTLVRIGLCLASLAMAPGRVAAGAEYLVTDDGSVSEQSRPRIAVSAGHGFVVVWEDKRYGTPNIMLQRYDLKGIALGSNTRVNSDSLGIVHAAPAIAVDYAGQYLLTWTDYRNGTYPFGPNVYNQRLDATGSLLGVNRRLTVEPPDSLRAAPDVALALWGGGMVVWEDYRNRNWDIYAQRIASDGSLIGSNFKINDDAGTAQQHSPRVAVSPDGWYVITWYDNRAGSDDIFVQRLDSTGTHKGQNIRVNSDATNTRQAFPDVAADGVGHFTVVWVDWRNGTYPSNPDIYARKYDTLMNPLFSDLRLNRDGSTRAQRDPSVAADRLGNVGIVWADSGITSFDITGQMIDVDGTTREASFKPHTSTDSAQVQPDIALDGRYRYTCWADNRSGNWDVYAAITLYNNPTLVPTPAALHFVMETGKPAPEPKSLIIAHSGYNKLSFAVRSSVPWLTVTPSEGTTIDTVSVSVTDTSLAEGTHSAVLTLVDVTNLDSSETVPVTFTRTVPNNDTVRVGSAQTTIGGSAEILLTLICSDSLKNLSLPLSANAGTVRIDSVTFSDSLPIGTAVSFLADSAAGWVDIEADFDTSALLAPGRHVIGSLWLTGVTAGYAAVDTTHVDTVVCRIRTALGEVRTPVVQAGDVTVDATTDVDEQGGPPTPVAYNLGQNYPNPFNGSTSITFDLPRPGPTRLDIFNVLGQKVALVTDRFTAAGRYTVSWDGESDAGTALPSGVYFYRLRSGSVSLVRKLVLLK
jgi:hypothetical protein